MDGWIPGFCARTAMGFKINRGVAFGMFLSMVTDENNAIMKKEQPAPKDDGVKKGYNEKNPGQPQGAFPPAADGQQLKIPVKSTVADKKAKEDAS